MSTCTHTFPKKHTLILLFHNAYFIICFTCSWNILFYASARCKTNSRLQCTITAFKASPYVFILLCIRSMLCRSSANWYSTYVLEGSLYGHHFLLLQLTSSWCCHCCIQFHKAIQTGALITTPVLLIVIAWPICDFWRTDDWQELTDMCNMKFDKTDFERGL